MIDRDCLSISDVLELSPFGLAKASKSFRVSAYYAGFVQHV